MTTLYLHRLLSKLRDESRLLNIAKLEVETDNILDNIIYTTNTDRALVVKIHNGGSKMYAGTDKYASVLYESLSESLHPIKNDWQKFPVDRDYMMMIDTLIKDGVALFDIETMKESTLSRAYKSEGVKSVAFFKIRETDFGFYFASFASLKSQDEFYLSKDFSMLEIKANKIRNIYAEADRKGVLH